MTTDSLPATRLLPSAPRHAFASRRLMGVRAGSPTILACLLTFGILAASALSAAPPHPQAVGTVAPVAHVATAMPHGN